MKDAAMSLQNLADLTHLLSGVGDLREMLETAADHACVAMGAATVSISQIDREADHVRTIINSGDLGVDEQRWPDDEVYPITGDGRLSSAMDELRSWTDSIDDPDCDPYERELLGQLGKGCSLAAAIIIEGESWGEFYATRHIGARPFDQDAIAFAEVVTAILGAAVSRAMRVAELETFAFHDALSGLFNRRGLDLRAAALFDLGDEPSRAVATVAVDMNGLKLVNDTEGHLRGDERIRTVAAALSDGFRPFDSSVVARVGGDEFTVMVAGDDVQRVESAINAVCRAVAARDERIGVSAGIASVVLAPASAITPSQLFAAADRALYVAKRTESPVAVRAEHLGVATDLSSVDLTAVPDLIA